MMKKFIIILVLVLFAFSGVACAGKKAGIEGKLVDGNEKPLADITVIATQKKPIKGFDRFEAKTKADGTFTFKGLFPASDYVLTPQSDNWKTDAQIEVQSGPEGQTSMVSKPFMVRYTLSKAGVLMDSKTGLWWIPSSGQGMSHDQAEGFVKNLNINGGGWRLPTILELRQIHPGHSMFNVTSENGIWSGELCTWGGTPNAGARLVGFYSGGDECVSRLFSNNTVTRVLAVRSPK